MTPPSRLHSLTCRRRGEEHPSGSNKLMNAQSKNNSIMKRKIYAAICLLLMFVNMLPLPVWASSHREAPLLLADPNADNTDLYAYRNPNDPNKVVIIANYVPFQLPQGGPNYYSFGENIRYEIHIDNNVANNTYFNGGDIVYRFTF